MTTDTKTRGSVEMIAAGAAAVSDAREQLASAIAHRDNSIINAIANGESIIDIAHAARTSQSNINRIIEKAAL